MRTTDAAQKRSDINDAAALASFEGRYRDVVLGPVVVVIPAYREAGSIAGVLAEVPTVGAGLLIVTLVVDDGSNDGTADLAEGAGAFVCRLPENRGQGAALRIGYRLAINHGARYVVSLDADGQYDPAEIPALLVPLVDGQADFVSGSRRLGASYGGDLFRQAGVVFFAAVIRALTGRRVTDPSFGLRAMTAEVAAMVPLHQPQFQAAELLIGAAMRGYRTTERPGSIRARVAGRSRKGPNIVYGFRFGLVVLSTWWRELTRQRRTRAILSTRRVR